MAINNIITTSGAPVTVKNLSALSGANTMWISASPGELIRLAIGGGGQIVGPGGVISGPTAIYTANTQGMIDPPVKIALPVETNKRATILAVATDQSGNNYQLILSYSPLLSGIGKIRWYGIAQGVPVGVDYYGELFADIDQHSDRGPMLLVGVRASADGVSLLDAVPRGGMGRLTVDDQGHASVRLQSTYAQSVGLQCSLPNSADGEVLSVNVTFSQTLW